MLTLWVVRFVALGLVLVVEPAEEPQGLKFSDCPPAVRKTFEAETRGAKIETVTREKGDDDETVYWADAAVGGKTYAVGVLEDGTLTEMNLAVDDEQIPFDRCPAPVKATFLGESFGAKIDAVAKDMKYGVTIFEAVVGHKGRSYEIAVAEDGALVEKVLVIDEVGCEFSKCPAAVQAALLEHAAGGTIHDVTRSAGINRPTYEAEVEIKGKGKVYLIEVGETGLLIAKSLEAGEE